MDYFTKNYYLIQTFYNNKKESPLSSPLSLFSNYPAVIASTGQAPTHAPQSIQASEITYFPSSFADIAATGQVPSHAPHPIQPSKSIICMIFPLKFIIYFELITQLRYTLLDILLHKLHSLHKHLRSHTFHQRLQI